MTRSPLQAANRIPHTDDRLRATKTTSMQREGSSRNQRERLTRDVLSRQQSSDIGSRSTTDTSVAGPVVTNLTPEQMYSNFEEWIKMATDNVRQHAPDDIKQSIDRSIMTENQCEQQLELCIDRLLSRVDFSA